jgi:hypothetical protein
MNLRHASVIALAIAASASLAPAAVAGPVKIPVAALVHTTFDGVLPDQFTSSVEGCESGTVENITPVAHPTPWGGVFSGIKSFECDGGTGGFAVRLIARFGENGSTGTWNLVDAWGDYAGAKGSGTLSGVPVEGGIDDHYVGTVR